MTVSTALKLLTAAIAAIAVRANPQAGLRADGNSMCDGISDANACITHTKLFVHVCVWCVTEGKCHDVGSLYDTCTNDCCASQSGVSTCEFKEPKDVPSSCQGSPSVKDILTN
eukprot:GFYU01005029.1.p1 GENE.GFYU01005029.1~~GFYU01005029.1.p1  ORF type:complete len:113 (-),score=36.06 GFYU01005029.1:167-505(-)